MAQRANVDTQRAGLALRLRPLYSGLRADEFERMVARIAEIELFGFGAQPPNADPALATLSQVVRHG